VQCLKKVHMISMIILFHECDAIMEFGVEESESGWEFGAEESEWMGVNLDRNDHFWVMKIIQWGDDSPMVEVRCLMQG
jgi:hypothetical protein